MTRLFIVACLLMSVAGCTTPENQTPAEAQAQKCRLMRSDCEDRNRRCQQSGDELKCRDAASACKSTDAQCPGF